MRIKTNTFLLLIDSLSDTSSLKILKRENNTIKGSIGRAFAVRIRTENHEIKRAFTLFVLRKVSVLVELVLGHLRYLLTDVPPQPKLPT